MTTVGSGGRSASEAGAGDATKDDHPMTTETLEQVAAQRDELLRVLSMVAPEGGVLAFPRLKCAGPTTEGQRTTAWVMVSAVRILFAEMEHSPPELRNRLTVTIHTHEGDGQQYTLTLAKAPWESLMEQQRDEARRERDALATERDALADELAKVRGR